MSRSNIYTKKFLTGANSPVGEFIKEIDIATMGAIEDVNIHDEFSWAAQLISCQVEVIDAIGTLTGTVDLQQSNNGYSYDLLGVQSLIDSADKSDTLKSVDFAGKYLGAKVTKGGLTGGTVKLHFIVKHH